MPAIHYKFFIRQVLLFLSFNDSMVIARSNANPPVWRWCVGAWMPAMGVLMVMRSPAASQEVGSGVGFVAGRPACAAAPIAGFYRCYELSSTSDDFP
jgi:hypothetical protein